MLVSGRGYFFFFAGGSVWKQIFEETYSSHSHGGGQHG